MSTKDIVIETLEGRVRVLNTRLRDMVNAVERYVEPKPGQPYLHRSELLRIKNDIKSTLERL